MASHFTLDDEEDIPDIDDHFVPTTLAPADVAAASPPTDTLQAPIDAAAFSDLISPSETGLSSEQPADAAAVAVAPGSAELDRHSDMASLQAPQVVAPSQPQPPPVQLDTPAPEPAPAPAPVSDPQPSAVDAATWSLSSAAPPPAQQLLLAPVDADAPATLTQAISKLARSEQLINSIEQQLQDLQGQHLALLQVERLLEHQKVLQVLQQPLGFDRGRPVAALLIYRCLLQWLRLSNSEQAPLLEQISSVLAAQVARDDDEDFCAEDGTTHSGAGERMAYWLTSTSVLLAMTAQHAAGGPKPAARGPAINPAAAAAVAVQQIQNKVSSTIKTWSTGWAAFKAKVVKDSGSAASGGASASGDAPTIGSGNSAASMPREPRSSRASALSDDGGGGGGGGEGAQAAPASATAGSGSGIVVVAADSSAAVLALRHALDIAVQKTYGGLRDHFKKQVAGLLSACVQVPGQRSLSGALSGGGDYDYGSPLASPRSTPYSPGAQSNSGSSDPWAQLVLVLDDCLSLLRRQHVPRILIKCLFKQLFGFLNIQLFNQLLLRPECCSSTNARFISAGLQRVDSWIINGQEDYLVTLYTDFKHIRQASSFLCAPNKATLVFEDVTHLCAALNLQQLYRLCTTFYDDTVRDVAVAPPPQTSPPVSPTKDVDTESPAADKEKEAPGSSISEGEDLVASSPPAADASPFAAASHTPSPLDIGLERRASSGPLGAAGSRAAASRAAGGDMVSGEVLEELKGHKEVTGNGGLIVTFLLDEDPVPLIAPHGTVVPEVLALIDSKGLYVGLAVPALLDSDDCPRSVFQFLEHDVVLA